MTLGGIVFAQTYPDRPVRIIASLPGGSSNYKARIIAEGISEPLGQQVIVDNRPNILIRQLIPKLSPDGYTFVILDSGYWSEPLMRNETGDLVKDVSPVILIDEAPNVLVVHPSLPVKSAKELIALAKAKPGVLNYGSANPGSSTHVAAEYFKSAAGINLVRIPYPGSDGILAALFSNDVQVVFGSTGSIAPLINSDKLKALAVTSARPSVLFPGLPTIDATGLPGYDFIGIEAVFAPAKTPAAMINRMNQEIERYFHKPGVKEMFLKGRVAVIGGSPQQLADLVRSDIARMSKVIKDAGLNKKIE